MEKKVVMAILVLRIIFSLVQILSKASFDGGANTYVFVFYKQAITTLILAPVAFAFERKNFPDFSCLDYFNVIAVALCGTAFANNTYFVGLSYTSATLGTAAANAVPVFTFVLAVLLRKEPIKGEYSTVVPKLGGVMLCLAGVVAMAFYKGPHLRSVNHHRLYAVRGSGGRNSSDQHPDRHWALGSFLLILASASWSLFLILQKNFVRKCPSMLLFTALLSFFGTFQTFLAALIFEPDFSKWKSALAPVDLLVYCLSGLTFFLQSWCVKKVGPVIYAMSVPLSLVITILISLLILGEAIPLGSVIGGALMVGGLYCVLLAKQKQQCHGEGASKEQQGNGNDLDKRNKLNPCDPPPNSNKV